MGKFSNTFNKLSKKLDDHFLTKHILLALSLIVILFVVISISLNVFTRHGSRYTVPSFYSMSIDEAKEAAKKYDLELEVIDSLYVPLKERGMILEQYPKGGSFVKKGRRIFLTINSFTPKVLQIPFIEGYSLRQAKNRLVSTGFVIDKIVYRDDIATYNVLQQLFDGKRMNNTEIFKGEVGKGVTLIVGLNPVTPAPIIPNIVGLSVVDAKNRLWEEGFNIGEIIADDASLADDDNISKVYSQSPQGESRAMFGRSVSFKTSTDVNKTTSASKIAKLRADSIALAAVRAKEIEDSIKTASVLVVDSVH